MSNRTHKVMARREWALKKVENAPLRDGEDWTKFAARIVTDEHARAVRIVKADLAEVKRDQHNYSVVTKNELVKRLERLLVKLTKGRA